MDNTDCIPQLLSLNLEDTREFYDNSNTLIDLLSNYANHLEDFINYNNAYVSPAPIKEQTNILSSISTKLKNMPNNIAFYWYKKINNQIDSVKKAIIKINPEFKTISDSIGQLSSPYSMYSDYTTPYYSYGVDNIRPTMYVPSNVFNKIPVHIYANLISASKLVDATFKHNLAPTIDDTDTNLIQSPVVISHENNKLLYSGSACSQTTHGENLVTDINAVSQANTLKIEIKKQITLCYSQLYNVINAIKGRSLLHTTSDRSTSFITFSSITKVDCNTEKLIWEMFDILQQKILSNKTKTIENTLK